MDIGNKFLLGMRNGGFAPQVPIEWPLKPDDALLLAAWLAAMADAFASEPFDSVLQRVRNT